MYSRSIRRYCLVDRAALGPQDHYRAVTHSHILRILSTHHLILHNIPFSIQPVHLLTPMKIKWHLSSKLWRHITQLDGVATEKTRFLNKKAVGTSDHCLPMINNIFLCYYFIFFTRCVFLYPTTRRNNSEDLLPQYEIMFATNKIVSALCHFRLVKRQLSRYIGIFSLLIFSLSPSLAGCTIDKTSFLNHRFT